MKFLAAMIFAMSSSAALAQAPTILIENATLIDGTGADPVAGRSVLIENGRIAAIEPAGTITPPADTRVIDLKRGYLLPGLMDGHVHMTPWRDRDSKLSAMLKSGITSVRDMGGDRRIHEDIARRVEQGGIAAPTIYSSANFFGPKFLQDRRIQVAGRGFPPGQAPWMRAVTDETDLPAVIAEAKASGVTGLKLYSQIGPELTARIVQEAHRQGLKVWSHATIFPSKPSDAVNAGIDTIIHSGMLFPESQDELPGDYHTGVRQWMPRQDFPSVKPDAPDFKALFAAMNRRGTIYEPTLAGSERFQASNAGSHLESINWDEMRDWGCAVTREAHEAGVTISAGTDNNGGAPLIQREMELLVGCGLSPDDAIAAATGNAARSIGIEATHGTIAVGKAADLLVVDRNPAQDIANIRSVRMVIKDGKEVAR